MNQLLDAAIHAAQLGGALLKEKFEQPRTIEHKDGQRVNLVTDADRASEALVLEFLKKQFPDHAVLGEESGISGGSSAYRWYVDPLDGTTNYAHQVPHFCITLAVEGPVEGESEPQLLAGVVFDPMLGELFTASRGEGAFRNGAPIRASAAAELRDGLLCTGFPYDLHQRPDAPLGLFNRIVRRAQGIRRMGSAALDLAYVACGRFDGFFEFGLKPWDTAAGALLIAEAGGTVTRIAGDRYDARYPDILAAGSSLHPKLAVECKAFLDELGWRPT